MTNPLYTPEMLAWQELNVLFSGSCQLSLIKVFQHLRGRFAIGPLDIVVVQLVDILAGIPEQGGLHPVDVRPMSQAYSPFPMPSWSRSLLISA
jgi:hypothetical protein